MQWVRLPAWLIGAIFVLLTWNAFAVWESYRILGVANLVIDGLILVYSVIGGYRDVSEKQRTRNPRKTPEHKDVGN